MTLLLPPPVAREDTCAFPTELIRHSAKVEEVKLANKSWREASKKYRTHREVYQGAQLLPLRHSDRAALATLFDAEVWDEVNADIDNALLVLWPEPCWEDDPFRVYDDSAFEFLAEFL